MSDDADDRDEPPTPAALPGEEQTLPRRVRRKKRRQKRMARQAARRSRKLAKRAARKEAKRLARQTPLRRLLTSAFVQRSIAGLMRFIFAWSRAVGRERASRIAARVARRFGPKTREHRVAAANIAAAFPEKSEEERHRILLGVWDNLARVTIEYAFMADILDAYDPDHPETSSIEFVGIEHVRALRASGGPSIIFGAHIANWELVAVFARRVGLPIAGLYRPPANPYVAAEIEKERKPLIEQLIDTRVNAARQVVSAMRRRAHVGAIIDQRIGDGQVIPFLGRPSYSNPIVGIMARLFDCPVHAAYCTRLADGRFRIEITPRLDLPRDATGKVDADGANVIVHAVIEQWVRECPEQWLWLHDRWRFGRRRDATP